MKQLIKRIGRTALRALATAGSAMIGPHGRD